MKIKLLFILFILCVVSSTAQNNNYLSDTTNRWYIAQRISSSKDSVVYYILKLQGNVIINRKHYFEILKDKIDTKETNPIRIGFLREDTLRDVYYVPANSNKEYLIYSFNQKPNVRFNIFSRFYSDYGNNDIQDIYVSSIDSVLTEGIYRKRYTIKRICKSYGKNTWIEGIGSVYGLLESNIHSQCAINGVIMEISGFFPTVLVAFTKSGELKYFNPYYLFIKNKLLKKE